MSIPLRVLGDRVLVKPDVQTNAPETLPSGITIATSLAAAVTGEDAMTSLHRGTVIGVGAPRHPLYHEAEALADKLYAHAFTVTDLADEAIAMLRDLVRRQPCVHVGDDVLFSTDAGQEVTIENETYVILREAELLAVVEPEEHDFKHVGYGIREDGTLGVT